MDEKGAPPTTPGYPQPPPPDPGYPQAPPQATYPPPQEQPGYPPQPQPQGAGYPQPQPGYPAYDQQQQAYPPQQPYPQQGLVTEAPPPYYPQQPPAPQVGAQQQHHNVVLVQQQPQVVTGQVYYGGGGDQGMALAIIATFVAIFFGCWLSLICTIPAIVFASQAQTAASTGDHEGARQNRSYSTGLSVSGIVFGVATYIALIITIIAIASS